MESEKIILDIVVDVQKDLSPVRWQTPLRRPM